MTITDTLAYCRTELITPVKVYYDSRQWLGLAEPKELETWGQCYKTFYVRYLQIFVTS
jgi:hypothetical protein